MIAITASIAISEDDINESFMRASGPGGQNVNKVATAVELRFDALGAAALPNDMKQRLQAIAGSRMTSNGIVIIRAEAHRSQERNRAAALRKLVELLRRAAQVPKPRRATRPTLASRKRRLEAKTRRSTVKRLRSGKPERD